MKVLSLMTEETTERDLIAACRDGDRDAFEVLFRNNQKRVYSVALNFFGGNRQSAEDVTQQVFLKLYKSLDSFRGDSKLTTWLYRVTVNACIDEQKKQRRFSFLTEIIKPSELDQKITPDDRIRSDELSEEIQQALATIKIKFRVPILLKYSEGLSYREMAEVLECSEGTVASRLNRGSKLLARKLEHLKKEL